MTRHARNRRRPGRQGVARRGQSPLRRSGGDGGLRLSGSQAQRLAIARALYHRPPVVVLDEATSALDSEAERAVTQNIARLIDGRTAFIVANRLSTIRDADLIVVLERGRIGEIGRHGELIARGGLYLHLYGQQLET